MIVQAFVLGAGLGKRMRPLTDDLPKPLIPIFGKPLLTFALDHLIAAGVESFVVNTHHLPERFPESLGQDGYRERPLRLLHEPVLLETGGGIKNAERFLTGENFLVYSGDILTDLPLAPLFEEHFRAGNDVTLALRSTGMASNVAFCDGQIIDIGNRRGHPGNYDYANVSVWNQRAFARFSSGEKISFVPVLAEWIDGGGKIGGIVIEQGRWFNLTSPNDYLAIHRTILAESWRPGYLSPPDWPVRIAPDVRIDPSARITGYSAIGAGCRIGAEAVVEDSILWPEAQVAPCTRLKSCIVRTHRSAKGNLMGTVL
ncbi:MAG: sugar phosphate nucleotidyltransferase [Chthoniobacterales bacterium]